MMSESSTVIMIPGPEPGPPAVTVTMPDFRHGPSHCDESIMSHDPSQPPLRVGDHNFNIIVLP